MNRLAPAVIGVALVLGSAPFILDEVLVEQRSMELKMSANATEYNFTNDSIYNLGVTVSDNLSFGEIPARTEVRKRLKLQSSKNVTVRFSKTGNISPHVEVPEKIRFKGNRTVEISFNASEEGYYEGQLAVKTEIPTGSWGRKWLELKSRFW